MGYVRATANINYLGSTYEISIGASASNFGATRNGADVTDAGILGALFGASQGLNYLERMTRGGGAQDLIDRVVNPANTVLEQAIAVKSLEAARDGLGSIAGGITAAYVTGGASLKGSIASAVSSAAPSLVGVAADGLDFFISGAILSAGKTILSDSINSAVSIVADINAGRTVDLSAIKSAADGTVDGNQIIYQAVQHLTASGVFSGNVLSDIGSFFTSAAGSFLGALGVGSGVTPTQTALIEGIQALGDFNSTLQAIDTVARAITVFVTDASIGFPSLSSNSISEYSDYFATTSPIVIAGTTTDLIDVTTGVGELIVSDTRIYVSEMVFLEGSSVQQGFVVQLSEAVSHDVTFQYSVYDFAGANSATAGSDFTAVSNATFTIAAGTTQAILPVTILNDAIAESLSETVYLQIYNSTGATFDGGQYNEIVKGYIVDDDITLTSSGTGTVQSIIDSNAAANNGEPSIAATTNGANLVAVSFGASSTGASSRGAVTVTYTVTNSGTEISGRSTVDIILAGSADFQTGSIDVAASFTLPVLDPGESRTYTRDITLPYSGNGNKFLGIEITPKLGTTDIVSTDNVASTAFTIGAGLSGDPDLRPIITSDLLGQSFSAGDSINFAYQISTNGNGSPAYSYQILYSKDQFASADDVVLFQETTASGLGYLGVHYYNKAIVLPQSIPDGIGNILVRVDQNNFLQESNELNNTWSRELVITTELPDSNSLPNIVATNVTTSKAEMVISDDPAITDRTSIISYGYLGSPDDPINLSGLGISVAYYLSTDSVFDATNDQIVFTSYDSPSNMIGDIVAINTNISIPGWVDTGDYFIFAVYDWLGEYAEDNEFDNVSTPFRISVINNQSRTVQAKPDTVTIQLGNMATVNVLANDTSGITQVLSMRRFNGLEGSTLTFTDNNGLIVSATPDGMVTIDSSGFIDLMQPGESRVVSFTYQLVGFGDSNSDLGELKVVIQDPRPSPVNPIEFQGDSGANIFTADIKDDSLFGNAGNDVFSSGGGNDLIDGGAGNDTLNADAGDDIITDPLGDDTVDGGTGNDQITLFSGTNTARGGSGNDFLIGGIQGDQLFGDAGNDIIIGDIGFFGGADMINGGTGNDIMMGGIGADVFVFATNDGSDIIADFDVASVSFDAINGYAASPTGADFEVGVDQVFLNGFTTVNAANVLGFITSTAQGAVFSAEGTDITFYGIDPASLTASDFLFL